MIDDEMTQSAIEDEKNISKYYVWRRRRLWWSIVDDDESPELWWCYYSRAPAEFPVLPVFNSHLPDDVIDYSLWIWIPGGRLEP